MIGEEIENELFAYLGGACHNANCPPLAVGGYRDHVHILCRLDKNTLIPNLIKKLKVSSSIWIKTKTPASDQFAWQDGYGAFSVNPSEVDTVVRYIQNQKEHHQTRSFQDEYLAFLKKYKVEYDERYLWR